MDQLEISIVMPPETLGALRASGASLIVLHALSCSDNSGQPLAWLSTDQFLATTEISWRSAFGAYLKPLAGSTGERTSWPMTLGQQLVLPIFGDPDVRPSGDPERISVVNQSAEIRTTGPTVDTRPIAAFTLRGNTALFMRPTLEVFLTFSVEPVPASGIVTHSTGAGVLVDLRGGPSARVGFEIDRGWSWQRPTRALAIPPGSPLQSILVGRRNNPPDDETLWERYGPGPKGPVR